MSGDSETQGLLPSTVAETVAPGAASSGGPLSGIPALGTVIADKYQVERVLGAGGMGVVLAARHVQLPQRVAIKFLKAETARDRRAVARFLREARAAAALSGEHVTSVRDVGTLETGEPYMVMEHLDGVDLAQMLRQHGRLDVTEAIGFVLQACEAIAEAHALGIVHRDLKPANLFLANRRDGTTTIKVLDFGISKAAEGHTTSEPADLTASGLVMGSPGYMSPEQARSAKGVDGRSDIWSLGVILYELTSGTRPFVGETVGEVFAQILTEEARSVRHHRPEIPEGLAAIMAQCLERRVERRIQNVGELSSRLVPYGPAWATQSLARILFWQDAGAPSIGAPPSGKTVGDAPGGARVADTVPQWVRSGPSPRGKRRLRAGHVMAFAAGGAAAVIAASLYTLGGRMDEGTKPTATSVPIPQNRSPAANLSGTGVIAASIVDPVTAAPPNGVHVGPPDAGRSIQGTAPPAHTVAPQPRPTGRPPSVTMPAPPPSTSATPATHEIDVF
jgi:eukaryotic-like serine/threonine-protein kinase